MPLYFVFAFGLKTLKSKTYQQRTNDATEEWERQECEQEQMKSSKEKQKKGEKREENLALDINRQQFSGSYMIRYVY